MSIILLNTQHCSIYGSMNVTFILQSPFSKATLISCFINLEIHVEVQLFLIS